MNFDFTEYLKGVLNNTSVRIAARLIKRNGDFVEMPQYQKYAEKANETRYLKNQFPLIKWEEAAYFSTYLTACGTLDLYKILQERKAPQYIILNEGDSLIAHHSINGAGEFVSDYKGKPKKMKAEFSVDGEEYRYGVDSIFSMSWDFWSKELEVV